MALYQFSPSALYSSSPAGGCRYSVTVSPVVSSGLNVASTGPGTAGRRNFSTGEANSSAVAGRYRYSSSPGLTVGGVLTK